MLKSVFESELVAGMQDTLIKQANNQNLDNLEQAVDHLNSAIDIFESEGLTSKADKILNILYKIAKSKKTKKPHAVSDAHTKGLTSEKMIENLKHHGTEFNMADISFDDDLDLDVDDNFNIDEVQFLESFEDELKS